MDTISSVNKDKIVESIIQQIDALPAQYVEKIFQHIEGSRAVYWRVPSEALTEIREIMQPAYDEIEAEGITDEEIDTAIDEAIAEVRSEQCEKANRRA